MSQGERERYEKASGIRLARGKEMAAKEKAVRLQLLTQTLAHSQPLSFGIETKDDTPPLPSPLPFLTLSEDKCLGSLVRRHIVGVDIIRSLGVQRSHIREELSAQVSLLRVTTLPVMQ